MPSTQRKHIAEINIKKISFHIFMIWIFFGAGFECRLLFLLMCTFNKWMLIVLDLFFIFDEVKLDNICWTFFFFICSSSRISLELLVHKKQLLLFSLSLILPFFLQINNYFALDHLLLLLSAYNFNLSVAHFLFKYKFILLYYFLGKLTSLLFNVRWRLINIPFLFIKMHAIE